MSGTSSSRENQIPLKVTFVGHVDHGKSTLVGRLLHDVGALPDGKVDQLRAISAKRGMPFEWSFVMDALQTERDQGITIDTTRTWFSTAARDYVIIDAPGHKEFLKNMVTGAAGADAAVLVIDGAEGVREQTKRHGYLLHLLGVRQVVVAINKMDLVEYSQERFDAVRGEIVAYLRQIGIRPDAVIPVAARDGDNLAGASGSSQSMPWYSGLSLLAALDGLTPPLPLENLPLRLPVQDIYKFDDRRIVVGRIESGMLKVGDTLRFSPSGKTAGIKSIESWNAPLASLARQGESVGITLDQPIFVERGQVASSGDRPPHDVNQFNARIFWLGREPLAVGGSYRMKFNSLETMAEVVAIDKVIDSQSLAFDDGGAVETNAVAEITLRTRSMVSLDDYADNPAMGRFVLMDGHSIAGGGIVVIDHRHDVEVRATNIHTVDHKITPAHREARNGHKGGVLWLTGLSGSGKSTLALELERQLHRKGFQVYVLDGDNVRSGLNKDLGFSERDRFENIRRISEVAALFADSGKIVITAFISPYKADRQAARFINRDWFHEIFVKADLETCEWRDPKGLYKKARAGEIPNFTGISDPYEAPDAADLTVSTDTDSFEECLEQLMTYIDTHFAADGIRPSYIKVA